MAVWMVRMVDVVGVIGRWRDREMNKEADRKVDGKTNKKTDREGR